MMNLKIKQLSRTPQLKVMNEGNNTHKMTMYGSIGTSWFEDISLAAVEKELSSIPGGVIELYVNSPGGDVFESIAIHNLLKNHPAEIHAHIDGIAASGMSLIVMAANKIYMPTNAMLMIHKASTVAYGNEEGFKKIAEDLSKIDESVTQTYLERFNGDKATLIQLLADETYLTAEESLAYGLCDFVDKEENNSLEVIENVIEKNIENNKQRFRSFVTALEQTVTN